MKKVVKDAAEAVRDIPNGATLALGGFGLVKHRLPQYRLRPANASMVSRRHSPPVAREPRPAPTPRTH